MYKHSLKDLVRDTYAEFSFLREGKAYYIITLADESIYEFPIDVTDIGTGSLMRTDEAILYMRWIRKSIESETLRVVKYGNITK